MSLKGFDHKQVLEETFDFGIKGFRGGEWA
jgi:hypothetical protein